MKPSTDPGSNPSAVARRMAAAHHQVGRWHEAITVALGERLDWRDERGDVAPRTVGIAIMAAAALAVGATIKAKLTAKADALVLD